MVQKIALFLQLISVSEKYHNYEILKKGQILQLKFGQLSLQKEMLQVD